MCAVARCSACALALLSLASLAPADVIVPLDNSGWSVSIPDLVTLGVSVDKVYKTGAQSGWYVSIQVSKVFNAAPDEDGVFPPIWLTFKQTSADAQTAPHIRIVDESITNDTGVAWTDFHWVLFKMGYASFNETASNVYAGGPPIPSGVFEVYPFTNYQWDSTTNPTVHELSVWGGTVSDGSTWYPGMLSSGHLQIDVDLANAPANFVFKLKEIPTPEPATVCLIAMGGIGVLLRRRRT